MFWTTCVCDFAPKYRRTTESTACTEPPVNIIKSTLKNLPQDLTHQRQQVISLLQHYEDVFFKGTFDMGRTTLIEHSIDTGQHRPIRQPLRRHPRAHLEKRIDRQVDELQQNDFIEPAASPWLQTWP